MPFSGTLEYEKSDNPNTSFVGRPFYRLTKPLRYWNDKVKPDYVVKCEVGFETDFASIPKGIPLLKAKDPRWQMAAVIHDRACKTVRQSDDLSMKEADLYLYYAMLDCGAGKVLATTFYSWVRAKHIIARQDNL